LDYFEKANQIYPEIHNLENVVQGDQYFSSCGHMNDTGARMFTTVVIDTFFGE
jgi:glutathionyl-hydroquinone reductase